MTSLLISFLEKTDFFEAPASTRFHGNYEGGLLEHSMKVYEIFKEKMNKILDYMSCEEDKRVIVNQNNKKIIISISDICTIESVKSIRSNSDILITTMSGELYVKGKLKEFNSKYENMLLFAHRSILVNIINIHKWMGNKIEMRNGRNVNISRSNMPILKEAFAENVLRRIGR
mgnify:FL=1